MAAFSLGSVWEETIAFLRRESALLLPVALSSFGPGQIMLGLAMQSIAKAQAVPGSMAGAEAVLLVPAFLVIMFGNIAIANIVLTPGISVGEALAKAGRGLPGAVLVVLLMAAVAIGTALIIAVAATVGAMTFGANPKSPGIGVPLVILMSIPMAVIMVRMLLLAPVVAMEKRGTIDTIRRIWALGRDNFWRLGALMLLATFLSYLAAMVELFVIGSLISLLAIATGEGELLETIHMVINAGIGSLLSMAMAVYLALVYRKVANI